ncbi:hypothetical protein J6590_028546, partial [Homalodisca vitripennis]
WEVRMITVSRSVFSVSGCRSLRRRLDERKNKCQGEIEEKMIYERQITTAQKRFIQSV